MNKYEISFLWQMYNPRHEIYLAEAEYDRLVRQAKESQKRKSSLMLKIKKTIGRTLVKLGERLTLERRWDEV